MDNLYQTGIRPVVDEYLLKQAEKRRDYGDFWSASSAGYCYRKNIFDRLKVPYTSSETDQARQQRVFQSGHIFHEFYQKITKETGLSIAQELELQDDSLMVRGHIDDLVLITEDTPDVPDDENGKGGKYDPTMPEQHLILYDYKTRNSRSFNYAKNPMETHELQVGTYMYMLRKKNYHSTEGDWDYDHVENLKNLTEARVLNIEKDTLRQIEVQYLYTPELEKKVKDYWTGLNKAWDSFKKTGKLPDCTCQSFMATERYNPYFYEGLPCSEKWLRKQIKEKK